MVRREPLRIIKERRKEKRSGQVLDGNNGGNREKEECVFSHLPSLTDGCPRSRPSFGGRSRLTLGWGRVFRVMRDRVGEGVKRDRPPGGVLGRKGLDKRALPGVGGGGGGGPWVWA